MALCWSNRSRAPAGLTATSHRSSTSGDLACGYVARLRHMLTRQGGPTILAAPPTEATSYLSAPTHRTCRPEKRLHRGFGLDEGESHSRTSKSGSSPGGGERPISTQKLGLDPLGGFPEGAGFVTGRLHSSDSWCYSITSIWSRDFHRTEGEFVMASFPRGRIGRSRRQRVRATPRSVFIPALWLLPSSWPTGRIS